MSMSRTTPLIAGNWKMYKTVAEAEAVHPGAAAAGLDRRRRRRRDLPAVPRARRDGRFGARLARRRSTRRTCTTRPRARSPARSRRRCWSRSDVHGVILGHSERREHFGETDRALQLEGAGGARGRAAADPVRRRDRGGARAWRHRAQAAPSGPGGPAEGRRRAARRRRDRLRADLGDRNRTGRHARAGPGGDRVRARARRRPLARAGRAHADPLRRQRQARQRRRAARAARTSTARSSAAPASRPSRSRRSSRAAG